MVRDTTIKVNVDVLKAVGAVGQLNQKFNETGQTAQRNAQTVTQSQQQMSGAIQKTGDTAAASAVKFQTMGQGMLNLSTAAVQTFTSFSNLDRAYNRAQMASVGLDRATDLLNRKQFKLNEEIAKNGKHSSKAILLTQELATARKDLAVKTEKLKIEEAAVLDVQLLFAANIANVGVSSLMIYRSAFEGVTLSMVKNKIATIANTLATKLNTLSKWSFIPAGTAQKVSLLAGSGALATHTLATKAATTATKLLTIALGPVGWIIMGISAALVAYETNFYGFKDSVNGFLGIQTETNEVVEEGTGLMNLQADAVNNTANAYDKLSTPLKNYNALMIEAAAQTGNATEMIKALQRAGGTLSGFSSGGITTQGTGGSGSGIGGSGGSNSQHVRGSRPSSGTQALENAGVKLPEIRADPFGDFMSRSTFYALQPTEQAALLAVFIEETAGMPGVQKAYMDLAAHVAIVTGNFTNRPDVKSQTGDDIANAFKDIASAGTGLPKGSNLDARHFNINQIGFGSLRGVDTNVSNRELVKVVFGIDIGNFANSVSRPEALRIGILERELGMFNVGNKRGRTGFSTSGVFEDYVTSIEKRRQRFREGTIGGRADEALAAVGNNATNAFQVARGSIQLPAWYTRQLAEQNRYQNTPEFFRESFVKSLLSGSYFGGVTSRSAVNALDGSPLLASEDRNLLKTVGLLGLDLGLKDEDYGNIQLVISKANKALKATGFEKSTILGLGQIAELTGSHRINSVLKAAFSSGFFPKMRGGMSYAGRVLWNDKRVAAQKAVMKNLTDRMLAKNFGIFDKVAYFSIANLTQQVFGDELQSEFANFDINIDPILNIGRNRFTSIIGNAERGYQEIDDRIRWIEQTNAETTGTSAI